MEKSLNFKLNSFDGPLDLLLQLIDREQVSIFDIPIVQITDQFLEYVDKINGDMETLSSFLAVASELLEIKCKMLLPDEKAKQEDDGPDPRMELVRRLMEYKLYKEAGKLLRKQEEKAGKNLYRKSTMHAYQKDVNVVNYKELIGKNTLQDLKRIFQSAIRRKDARKDPVRASFGTIEKEPVDSKKSEAYIRSFLKENPQTTFFTLTKENKEKEETVVDFLLLLEMAKAGDIELNQLQTFEDISICKK